MSVKRAYTDIAKDVKAAQNGNAAAMDRILADVQDSVYYTCLRILRSEEDARDVTQEILITAYRKIGTLRDPGTYVAWVNRITANRCKQHLSQTKREVFLSSDEDGNDPFAMFEQTDEQSVPDKVVDNAETQRMILGLVDSLPDEQRMCVMLYYFDEMKTREIADALNVSEGTIKSRLNYARKSIKEGVERYEKSGFKLYGITPIPFLGYYLGKLAKATKSPVTAEIVRASAARAAAGAAVSDAAATATGNMPAAAAAGAAAKSAGSAAASIGIKVATAVVSVGLLAGVGTMLAQRWKTNRTPTIPEATETPEEEEHLTEFPDNRSDKEIIRLYYELSSKRDLAAYQNDSETFRSCFSDKNGGETPSMQAFSGRFLQDQLCQRDTFVAARSQNSFWIVDAGCYEDRMNSATVFSEQNETAFVCYENGRLYYLINPDAALVEKRDAVIAARFEPVCPTYAEEMRTSPKSMWFGDNYLFLNDKLQITAYGEEKVLSEPVQLWQTEAGETRAAFWITNGTEETLTDYQFAFDVMNEGGQPVSEPETFRGTEPIPPHRAILAVFTVPADRPGIPKEVSFDSCMYVTAPIEILESEPAEASPEESALQELPPEEQIVELFWDLVDDSAEAAKRRDYQTFADCFENVEASEIEAAYGYDWEQYDAYTQRKAQISGSGDGYYWIIAAYDGAGDPTDSLTEHVPVHYRDGRLRFIRPDPDQPFPDSMIDGMMPSFYESLSPEFAQDSAPQNAFWKYDSNCRILTDSRKVTRGTIDVFTAAIRQTDSGECKALVLYTNGTGETVVPQQTRIVIQNEERNAVTDYTVAQPVTVPAHRYAVRVFTIPANAVHTDFWWGNLRDETEMELNAPVIEQVSDGRIMELYWDLFDEMVNAANRNDYEAFRALYYDTDASVIRQDFGNNWRKYDEYDHRDGFVAGSKDGYCWIAYTFYNVTGVHPNTRRNSTDGYVLAHYENGGLQLAYGMESREVLSALSNEIIADCIESAYPGFGDEFAHARNSGTFYGNNYLFLNSDMVYQGSYDTRLFLMWQTENGDVKAALWYANGTNGTINAYKTEIQVTDDTLGTIVNATLNETVSVPVGHSRIVVFTIPASSVQTGVQTWTTMHAHVSTSY